jgi:4-aminobutyrate aminotransferase-like enzyme
VTWVEAERCRVVGGDGRRLLDLSGGFGVAALGHRNPEVGEAIVDQAARCVHALGDLAEADVTAELRRQLGLGRHHVIAALVVLERVPALLDRVLEAGERFERAGWHRAGLMRAKPGDSQRAYEQGVIVVPAGLDGELMSATPPLTIGDEEIDEALELLA